MIIREKTKLEDVENFTKVIVDIKRKILAYGCEMHLDCFEDLLQDGSRPENLWGANVYPKSGKIDYDSMVNVRPGVNRSMEILDPEIKLKVTDIIHTLVQ